MDINVLTIKGNGTPENKLKRLPHFPCPEYRSRASDKQAHNSMALNFEIKFIHYEIDRIMTSITTRQSTFEDQAMSRSLKISRLAQGQVTGNDIIPPGWSDGLQVFPQKVRQHVEIFDKAGVSVYVTTCLLSSYLSTPVTMMQSERNIYTLYIHRLPRGWSQSSFFRSINQLHLLQLFDKRSELSNPFFSFIILF